MNLLHLLGEHRRRAAVVVLVLVALVVAVVGIGLRRSVGQRPQAPPAAVASRPTPGPERSAPSSTPSRAPSEAAAEATALAFCREYFTSSWQESPAQEEARVAPYLTRQAMSGWRVRLTPVEVAARETASVTACSATDEGPAADAERGFFLDAQVVTSSTTGTQSRIAAAEVFLVPDAGSWRVDQVRA